MFANPHLWALKLWVFFFFLLTVNVSVWFTWFSFFSPCWFIDIWDSKALQVCTADHLTKFDVLYSWDCSFVLVVEVFGQIKLSLTEICVNLGSFYRKFCFITDGFKHEMETRLKLTFNCLQTFAMNTLTRILPMTSFKIPGATKRASITIDYLVFSLWCLKRHRCASSFTEKAEKCFFVSQSKTIPTHLTHLQATKALSW